MDLIYNCAVDGGNSSINIIIDGVKFKRTFPSIQSDPSQAKISYNNATWTKDTTKHLWDKLHVETTMHIDNERDKYRSEFLFGKMAEEYHKDLRSRGNKEKYQDKELAKWMITALAYALLETKIKNEGYEIKPNSNIQFNVNLATGLPYREGSDESKKQQWARLFQATHRIEFKHPLFQNLVIDLVVENAIVLVEGELALRYELNRPGGLARTSNPQDLLNKRMVIIDIGGHTTEIVTIGYELMKDDEDDGYDEYDVDTSKAIRLKQVVRPHMIEGMQRGVATIMEDLIPEIEDAYVKDKGKPLRDLSRRDIELAFTRNGLYDGKIGWILPEKIYIYDMFNSLAENLAMDIVQRFHTLFQGYAISEIDTIYLAGGGSRVNTVSETLRRELGVLGYNKEKIVPVSDPVFVNAIGYYYAMTIINPEAAGIEGE